MDFFPLTEGSLLNDLIKSYNSFVLNNNKLMFFGQSEIQKLRKF